MNVMSLSDESLATQSVVGYISRFYPLNKQNMNEKRKEIQDNTNVKSHHSLESILLMEIPNLQVITIVYLLITYREKYE